MLPKELRIAAARHFLGRATTDELVAVAHAVLDNGVYAHGLGEIATSHKPILSDVGPLFKSALDELGVQVTSWDQAVDILTEVTMVPLAEGAKTPRTAIGEVYDDYRYLVDVDRMKRRELSEFGALGSLVALYYRYEYADTPEWFEQVDKEAVRLAKNWCRARWFHLLDPEWRTSTVVALAQQMYESRDFSPMPILADALQDAGCDNDDILTHCRDANGVHVRGCWVVDLVLGKS